MLPSHFAVNVSEPMDNPLYDSRDVRIVKQLHNPVYEVKSSVVKEAQAKIQVTNRPSNRISDGRVYDSPLVNQDKKNKVKVKHEYDSADIPTPKTEHVYDYVDNISTKKKPEGNIPKPKLGGNRPQVNHEYDSADKPTPSQSKYKKSDEFVGEYYLLGSPLGGLPVPAPKASNELTLSDPTDHEYDLPSTQMKKRPKHKTSRDKHLQPTSKGQGFGKSPSGTKLSSPAKQLESNSLHNHDTSSVKTRPKGNAGNEQQNHIYATLEPPEESSLRESPPATSAPIFENHLYAILENHTYAILEPPTPTDTSQLGTETSQLGTETSHLGELADLSTAIAFNEEDVVSQHYEVSDAYRRKQL